MDIELFIVLADFMEKLTELKKTGLLHLHLYLEDLEKFLITIKNEKYSPIVQRMLLSMEEELNQRKESS